MKSFEDIARSFLEAVTSELDVYTSIKGKIFSSGNNSMTLETPGHIHFAKNGRPSGKNPPLKAMLQLVRSKNILFDGMDERGTAFALQAIIAKKGTKNYKPNAPDTMEEAIAKYQNIYMQELGESVLVEIDDQLKREMQDVWNEQGRLFKNFKI